MTKGQWGTVALAFTVGCVVAAFFAPPFAQPASYHDFSDQRSLFGIPNFGDVASNLAFLYVGIAGLWAVRKGGRAVFINDLERVPYAVFFTGVLLTSVGSSYYHLAPDNDRLVWDRLPITLALMGLVTATLAERVNVVLGRALTLPAAVVGLASVWYWQWTSKHGAENLMPYIILQCYAILMVLLLALAFPPRYTHGTLLIGVFLWYALAKLLEWGDSLIFSATNIASGHTLKHLVSGLATYWVLRMLIARRPLIEAPAT